MIQKKKLGNNNPLFVEFETDIMINTGQFSDANFVDVYFTEVEKGEIGKGVQRENHKEKNSNEIEIPIAFRFYQIESIEAVISQLQNAKEMLINNDISGVREVFRIASFDKKGKLTLLKDEFDTYPEAEKHTHILSKGVYQIQKLFVKF